MEIAKHFILGGMAFWAPIMMCMLFGLETLGLVSGSVISPALVILGWHAFSKPRRNYPAASALAMLVGVWVMGVPAMTIGGLRAGTPAFDSDFLSMWLLFPITTWVYSAYNGSLFGLVVVTGYFIRQTYLAGKLPSNHLIDRPAAR